MKKILNIIAKMFLIGIILFICITPKITITCTDGDGKQVTFDKIKVDSSHQKSWNKFGK